MADDDITSRWLRPRAQPVGDDVDAIDWDDFRAGDDIVRVIEGILIDARLNESARVGDHGLRVELQVDLKAR